MKKILTATFVLALLSGCVAPLQPVEQGRKIDTSKFSQVIPCKTTKSELLALFGPTTKEGRENGFNIMAWQYFLTTFTAQDEQQHVFVFLNDQDVLVDYSINPKSNNLTPSKTCE
jgi:outer membrane protein assembly factor BamE (lipoprotein component of BamABCDE complex)